MLRRRTIFALVSFPVATLLATACGGDTLDTLETPSSDASADTGTATMASTDATFADGARVDEPDGAEGPDGDDDEADGSQVDGATDGATNGDADAAGSSIDASADAPTDAPTDADARADADADAGDGSVSLLGSARTFAVLAGSSISITPSTLTTIAGDVGVSPGTSIMTLPAGQPRGSVYAGGPVALQAEADLTTAYNTLAAMPCLPVNNMAGTDLGGLTLAPGVYCFPATSAQLTGTVVLDAQLNPNAKWVFQIGTTLTTASNAAVTVINGGSACNVYWEIGTSATIGTGTAFLGNLVAAASITMVNGSSLLLGRALARNAAVTLDANPISASGCQAF